MMQTISSEKTLMTWARNSNMSNIFVSALGGDELFVKPHYEELFRCVAASLKAGPVMSFVQLWLKACDDASAKLADAIAQKVSAFKGVQLANAVERVGAKFKGNAGEIMVEMLAENGVLDFIKPGSYMTVDPDNEQYIDAEAVRDGLPIGIQIKNYNLFKKIDREVLTKASAMSDLWLRRDKKVRDEDILDFIKTPCQYVVSTSDVSNDLLLEDYKSSVVILGPKWLDTRKIQGSVKTGEAAMWRMFRDVADEIRDFKLEG